jgi:hypothetical protein
MTPAFPEFDIELEHVVELQENGPPPPVVFVDKAARVGGGKIGPSEQGRKLFGGFPRGFHGHACNMGAARARDKQMSLPGGRTIGSFAHIPIGTTANSAIYR